MKIVQLMQKLWYLIMFIIIISGIVSFEIVTFDNNTNTNQSIFQNNLTNQRFIYNNQICCKSSIQGLYIARLSHSASISNFTIIKDNNDLFPLDNITIWLDNTENITVHSKTISNENIIELHIENICNTSSSLSDYQRLITVSFDLNNTSYHFDYMQSCNLSSNTLNHILMVSTILLIMASLVFLATKFTIDNNLLTELKKKTNTIIDWKYGIAILFVSLVTIILLQTIPFKSIVFYIISTGILFFILLTIYLTSASCLKSILRHQSFPKALKDILKKETFRIKRYKIIPATLSISLIIHWLISPSWLLSNVLFFTILFASVSLFSIPNFKTLLTLALSFILYDLFWIISGLYLNSIVLENIDQPIKLIMPRYANKDLYHPYFFISLMDILIVCFFVKYSKCFDVVKENVTYAYYKTSLIVFIIGGIVTVVIQLMLNSQQVFLFPLEIVLFIGGIIRAIVKNELSDYWNGENAEGIKKVVSDIVTNGNHSLDINATKERPDRKYFQRVGTEETD